MAMNLNRPHPFADYLLDEIGQIDDRFIAEAATAYRPARKVLTLRRALILAATLTLAASLVLGLFIGGNLIFGGAKSADPEGADNAAMDMAPADGAENGKADEEFTLTAGTAALSLSSRLTALKDATASLAIPAEELELGNGTPMVIWQYEGETSYRVKALTARDYTALTQELSGGTPYVTEETAGQVRVRVWLASATGEVCSPYLSHTPDTVTPGTLFAYDPQQEPSAAFTDALYRLLTNES